VSTEGQQVAEILEQHGFDVVGVPDPTEDVLRNRVDEFIDDFGFNRDHRLLIYFGGHGFSRENRSYIVPVDAPNPIGGEEATRALLQKSVNMSEIMSWALRIEAKHVLFVFDSCFSGDLFKSRGAPQVPPSYVVLSVTKPVRQFITAGSQGEEVPAESKFTPLLVSGLRGYADADADSYITGTELGQFLFVNMPKEVGQTPQMEKISDPDLREGEILFRVESPPRELLTKTSNCERQLLELTFQLDDAFKV
jgi:uncharacterized caspase-like protein